MENNIPPQNTALAIASSADNIGLIVSNTPQAYRDSLQSHDNCLKACSSLLEEISRTGMTDELDSLAARYIEKTRRTIREMNERRSPVTKLFDRVRTEFTTLENDIDPSRSGTVPFRLQQLRDDYAARKLREEQERVRAEAIRRQAEASRERYRIDCADDYKAKFNTLLNTRINEISNLVREVTLHSWQAVYDSVSALSAELDEAWQPASAVQLPLNLPPEETRAIREEVLETLRPEFLTRHREEIGRYRRETLDRLPSMKTELERAAKASADEAARIKAEIAQREAAEAARKESERLSREQEEARLRQAREAGAESASLFDTAMAETPSYQPRTKVTKRIRIKDNMGYMKVMSMWWAREGCRLSFEELDKVFKKQISFCEKVANKEQELINDPSVEYIDEVKAK